LAEGREAKPPPMMIMRVLAILLIRYYGDGRIQRAGVRRQELTEKLGTEKLNSEDAKTGKRRRSQKNGVRKIFLSLIFLSAPFLDSDS
jgi:hypothetical protein